MKVERLLAHIFPDGIVQVDVPEPVRFRWIRRMMLARQSCCDIIHVTPLWPLRRAPRTGLNILTSEPVFWDPLRTIFDCRNMAPAIDIRLYGSFEIIGICPDRLAVASRQAIEKRCPDGTVSLDTVSLDEAVWRRKLTAT